MFSKPYNGINIYGNDSQDANGQFGLRDYSNIVLKNNLGSLMGMQSKDLYDAYANKKTNREQARRLATPQGRAAQTQFYGNQKAAEAYREGQRKGAMLRALGGGQAAERGAMLDSMNRASDAITAYGSQMESPESLMNQLSQLMQMDSSASIMDALPLFLQISGAALDEAGLKESQRDKGLGLGSLFGMLGNVAGGMDWTKLLGGR